MILVDTDLEKLVSAGQAQLLRGREPSAFSLEAGLAYFCSVNPGSEHKDDLDYDDLDFAPWPTVLEPGVTYVAPIDIPLDLQPGFRVRVGTRSSYARLGLWAELADSRAFENVDGYVGAPLVLVRTAGTRVALTEADRPLNILIDAGESYVSSEELGQTMRDGRFTVEREGTALTTDDLVYGHVPLTMGPTVSFYKPGCVLRAGQHDPDAWETVDIRQPRSVPQGAFFLSASCEYVRIPDGYVGIVEPVGSAGRMNEMFSGVFPISPFISHPNAPFVGPQSIFHGTVTFENFVLQNSEIVHGMHLSDLRIERLSGNPRAPQSRYIGQVEPENARPEAS